MQVWEREIRTLARDFCLNTIKITEIIQVTKTVNIPQGKNRNDYLYDRAYAHIKPMLMEL